MSGRTADTLPASIIDTRNNRLPAMAAKQATSDIVPGRPRPVASDTAYSPIGSSVPKPVGAIFST